MLHFIVCDDNVVIREKINKIITKLMLPTDVEYKTIFFSQYDKQFFQTINKKVGKKIYILDIEVGTYSGIDIARKIRERDWESIIIILTAHYELAYDSFKKRLMLLDFISKFDDYQTGMYEALQLAIKILGDEKQISFKIGHTIHKIYFNDILYITKDENKRNVFIKTLNNEYAPTLSLNKIFEKLGNEFVKTHRACIVNKNHVASVDFKNNIITFDDGSKIDLLSRNYKKEVKKYVCS